MSNFTNSNKFTVHNNYFTQTKTWKDIQHIITAKYGDNVTIWECFLLNSNEQSKRHLQSLNFKVIGDRNIDFFNDNHCPPPDTYDLIVSNPPYERIKSFKQRKTNLKYRCIERLFNIGKPFIILLNSTNLFQKWFKELVDGKDIKFIIPSKKIQFDKYDKDGKTQLKTSGSCAFNTIYVCYKVIDRNMWV